ncbi:MAG: DUF488 domain-containing protein [Fimbriimonadales bacterium]|nr:DUF488 domain-containing protein [Fimbriimonadales bacterium]
METGWAQWEALYHKDPALYEDEPPAVDEEELEFGEALDSLTEALSRGAYPAGAEPDPEEDEFFWLWVESLGVGQQEEEAELPLQRWTGDACQLKDTPILATVGYQGWRTPDALYCALTRAYTRWVLVDVRYRPQSPNPNWRRETLQRVFSDRYRLLPEWGNAAHASGGVRIVDYEAGKAEIRALLHAGITPVLLCACRDWETCHRRVVAERFAQETGVAVQHLTPMQETTPSLFEENLWR